MLADLAADVATVEGLRSTVHVQARNHYDSLAAPGYEPVGETRWLADLAARDDLLSRIVAHVDLRLGTRLEGVLAAHEAAGRGRFAGVRHTASYSDDPELVPWCGGENIPDVMLDPEFGQGLAVLQSRGLTYETWIYQYQLSQFATLAAQHDEGVVILDHLGGLVDPGNDDEREQNMIEWEAQMAALIPMDHVFVKIGGFGIPSLFRPSRVDSPVDAETIVRHWSRPVQWCLDNLGPGRCMAGSNFPVDRWLSSYRAIWDSIDLMIEQMTASEKDLVRCATAERAYGLDAASLVGD